MFGNKGTNKIWNINYFLFFFYQRLEILSVILHRQKVNRLF